MDSSTHVHVYYRKNAQNAIFRRKIVLPCFRHERIILALRSAMPPYPDAHVMIVDSVPRITTTWRNCGSSICNVVVVVAPVVLVLFAVVVSYFGAQAQSDLEAPASIGLNVAVLGAYVAPKVGIHIV